MLRKSVLLRKTKAELVALLLTEGEQPDLDARESNVAAVKNLAKSLGGLTAHQRVDVATALSLASALDDGPELSKAGIAKQLGEVKSRLEVVGERKDFVDDLIADSSAVISGPDSSEDSGRA